VSDISRFQHILVLYRLMQEPVTAITWGHSDKKLFVATNSLLHTVKISRDIPSLQAFCQGVVAGVLSNRSECFDLVLPTKLKVEVAGCYDPLIQVRPSPLLLISLPTQSLFPIFTGFFPHFPLLFWSVCLPVKVKLCCFVVFVPEIPCRFGVAQPFLCE